MILNYSGIFNKSKEDCLGLRICWCLQLSRRGTSITFSDWFYFAPCRKSKYVTIGNHEYMAGELLVNIGRFSWWNCLVECCEKYKSFKLKIPQPDSERRHSPDFRTVFGIMIGPFSSCEIGKT